MNFDFLDNKYIRVVNKFSDLVHTEFQGTTNALCWQRHLHGNFKELVSKLPSVENLMEVQLEDLLALQLSPAGNAAREIILHDLKLLTDFGASPSLNLIKNYPRDEEFDFISTDVYSYHVDRSPVATDTYLCTYYGAASDILPNKDAEQKILIPEIREKLKALHQTTDTTFETFLETYFFDLHYQAKVDANPINLGLGHLWRLAVDHPGQCVLPCIHRAPIERDGEYRLLLIC
ncbi:DUF1826 domain-containing protein [Pedobacter sp. MW01-1-1]|uniref:DUF1826 domain-containing protein n=1 Tax=Pedobacter sp. MW01-1-1 TaxID=3383027 RepID=UPI003FEEE819